MNPESSDKNNANKTTQAEIVWDENDQPYSKLFDDIYFSRTSGLEETRYIFLEQNRLIPRWQRLNDKSTFLIAESGLGTGLNFLATWQLWDQFLKTTQARPHLHYYSVEKFPLPKTDLQKALSLWPELARYAKSLEKTWPPHFIAGPHKIEFPGLTLNIFFGDIIDGLKQLLPSVYAGPDTRKKELSLGARRPLVDAWFLDGFAPAKNPEMWDTQIFCLMSKLSKAGSTFATFTSAGSVRRGLKEHGFECKKIKGFGDKREMLLGRFSGTSEESNSLEADQKNTNQNFTSWHLVETNSLETHPKTQYQEKAIVVGGGLAGCHIAYALARRGSKVTLLEQCSELATAASGNRRGILYTRLSPHSDPLSRFNLSALLYACHFYENENLFTTAGEQCGVLHIAKNNKENGYYQTLAQEFAGYPEILSWLPTTKSQSVTGIQLQKDGIFLAKAGWLDPAKVCRELCSHPNIEIVSSSRVSNFSKHENQWIVQTDTGASFQAPLLLLANAQEISKFRETQHLPLNSIRGQVSYLKSLPEELPRITTAICGDGYIAPLDTEGLCIGASFNINETSTEISALDHSDNLLRFQQIYDFYPEAKSELSTGPMEGQVGFRCTTPDYFPIAGPVPVAKALLKRFERLSKNANASIDACGVYYPGLFCLTGLGSRGLAYAPLAADAIASSVYGEPLPISLDLWLHIHPSRFLIRNLIRNRPNSD